MRAFSSRLFTWRQIFFLILSFVGAVVVVQRVLRYLCANWITFDCPYYWPVSVFEARIPSLRDIVVALAVAVAFLTFFQYLERRRFKIWLSILLGALLIAGLTFINGLDVGYYAPVAGDAQSGVLVPYSTGGQEYYHDALTITVRLDFLQRYNEIQPTLHRHAHTHPPGAVLTFYALEKALREPALIAIVIMLIATIPTVFFFYRLMRTEVSDDTAKYMAFVILLLPAIQIYYLATLDALVAALLIATVYLFCFGSGRKAIAGATVLLTTSFLLTFVSLFMLPVLVGFDLLVRRSLKRSSIVIGGLVIAHVLLYLFTGYSALQSFQTASLFENPNGFMLFVDPVNYIFTRIEDVAEIIFFFGPFLTVLFIQGLKNFRFWPLESLRSRPLFVLTALACMTLLAMFISGAFRTGETARACAFIYPFLLFPIGQYLEESGAGVAERLQLASLVFFQSIAMQTLGNYHW